MRARGILSRHYSDFRYMPRSWHKRTWIDYRLNRHRYKENEARSKEIPCHPRYMVLDSDDILWYRPYNLFHLQPRRKPQAILVFCRIGSIDLRLYLCTYGDLLFWVEEISRIYRFNIPVYLFTFVHLCGIYEGVIVVFNCLHRHLDGVCAGIWTDPVSKNKLFSL